MLSYSTGDSGSGVDVDKVREATRLVRERSPELLVDGPIQYDAAIEALGNALGEVLYGRVNPVVGLTRPHRNLESILKLMLRLSQLVVAVQAAMPVAHLPSLTPQLFQQLS